MALKSRRDVTRSSKQGYQWSHKKDLCPPEVLKINTYYLPLISVGSIPSSFRLSTALLRQSFTEFKISCGSSSTHLLIMEKFVITDRIRSMGEGYVFTGVCHSVHRRGGCLVRGEVWVSGQRGISHFSEEGVSHFSEGGLQSPPPPIQEYGQRAVSTHPIGMYSCLKSFFVITFMNRGV